MSHFRNESDKPHFVIIPLAAQGHLIPLIDMGHLLAERGVHVSLILTKENADRIKPIIERAKESNLSIEFIELSFPDGFGLPEGCESVEQLTSLADLTTFFAAIFSLNKPFEAFIESLERPPDCMISDVSNAWTAPIARKFNIPRIIFQVPSGFYLSACSNLFRNKVFDTITNQNEYVTVPDFPVKLEVTKAQMIGFLNIPGFEDVRKKFIEEESSVDEVVINTFFDLERPFLENYEKMKKKKLWSIGPLCLYNKNIEMQVNRGSKEAIDQTHGLLTWLTGKDDASVLYINFGSIAHTSPKQLMEIGSALEMSGKPFIWALKKAEIKTEVENWLTEFKERAQDRGLVIIGWAPQMVILSHQAVGGFLTHCGWNSVLEAVCMGVPMITWPRFYDQFANENFVVDVLNIGISLGAKVLDYAFEDSVAVKSDVIMKAVLALMDGGIEAKERRERTKDFSEKAKKAMEEGGSSYNNLNDIIHYVTKSKAK